MEMFSDRVAIVTGGASGIGRSLGKELVKRGATVVLADLNKELLDETVESIIAPDKPVEAAALNVTDVDAVKNLVDRTVSQHGRLDYIFNNAGIAVLGYAKDFSYDDWRTVLDVNLYGVVNGVFAAYPIMAKQGYGHIVNTASLAGLIPAAGEISYTASKYGVVGLSNALRLEAAEHGVKVSVVCPGFIETPIFYNAKLLGLDRKKMIDAIPKPATADECASVILRGVERNKATIVVTRFAKILWMLQRISPAILFWIGKGYTKKMGDLIGDA
jgi:NAD(P)-dependent dehydrogenase (short-subunit alcohol dehydrogenase family)